MYPVLQRCINDVRYNGPMRTIRYEYQNDGPHGAIINEKNPGIGAVSAITPAGNIDVFTETRGDGPTRSFTYTHMSHCQGTECGPCDDVENNNPPQQMLDHYTDFQGQVTYLGYDANWYINSVRDANIHTTSYTRGAAPPNGIGQITRITHPGGTIIDYSYYSETGHLGGHYIYTVTDERGGVTVYNRDANHRVTSIDYKDSQNNVLAHEDFVYNPFGQVTRHKLKNGNYVHYQYDGRGLLLYKWNPTSNATAQQGDPKTTYTYYTYWPWGDRVKTETLPANISGYVPTETYEYDKDASNPPNPVAGRGLVTKIAHADGKYRTASYSQFGNKMWEENELRQRTSYAYDNYNRVLSITNPMYKTESFVYLKPGTSSAYLYTTNSVYTHTSGAGIVTTNVYDPNWRKTSTTVAGALTSFAYDNVGNLTWVTDPLTHKTYNAYDNRNRKTSATEAWGTTVASTTVWHYDGASNINQIDRPDGTHEWKGFDALNRVIWTNVRRQNPGYPDPIDLTTNFTLNPSGTVQQVLDPDRNSTTFAYDASDRKTQMTYPGGTQYQAWTYDNAGNLSSRRTVNSETQNFSYDNRNRKTGMSWSNGVDSASYTYYDDGRLHTASNPNSTVTRTYYADGRLEHDNQAVAGGPAKEANYVYDGDGNVTWMNVDPYDNPSYNWDFSYDGMGRLDTISPHGGAVAFRYQHDGASNVTRRYTYLPSNVTVQQFTPRDSLNRMAGRWIYKNNTPFAAQGYTYDRMNRLTTVTWGSIKDMFSYYWDSELFWAQYAVPNDSPFQGDPDTLDPDTDTTDSVDPLANYQPPDTEEPEPTPPPADTGSAPANTLSQLQAQTTAGAQRIVGYGYDRAGNRWATNDSGTGTLYYVNSLNQYTGVGGTNNVVNGPEH